MSTSSTFNTASVEVDIVALQGRRSVCAGEGSEIAGSPSRWNVEVPRRIIKTAVSLLAAGQIGLSLRTISIQFSQVRERL